MLRSSSTATILLCCSLPEEVESIEVGEVVGYCRADYNGDLDTVAPPLCVRYRRTGSDGAVAEGVGYILSDDPLSVPLRFDFPISCWPALPEQDYPWLDKVFQCGVRKKKK